MDGISRIDELEKKFIENPRRYFAPLANEYRKAGNPHQAIAICRAHLGQLPGHMSGQIVYGQALFEAGEYDQARTVFENALAMDRENLVALRHLGDLALREGETAAARQWYEKMLEIDPRDAAVIALVNEIDASNDADAESKAPAANPANEGAEISGSAAPSAPPVAPEPPYSDEEDKLMSEELGYPVPPPQVFVTETMAELYLAQGFRDRAIGVYHQLLELRPDDEHLRSRLAEIEVAPAGGEIENEAPPASAAFDDVITEAPSEESAIVDRRDEQPSVESPATEPDVSRSPSIETPTPSAPAVQSPSEESTGGDGFTPDSAPGQSPAEADSVEAPSHAEPRAEPEGIAAQLTVREFFAGLGRRRPSSRSSGTSGNGAPYLPPGGDTLVGSANESDADAAASLAGAFSSSLPGQSGAAAGSGLAAGKESEEDVAKFRAWLDGLTGE